MAIVMFSWIARERAYVGQHDTHTYAVSRVPTGWLLTRDGAALGHGIRSKPQPLMRAAQEHARTHP